MKKQNTSDEYGNWPSKIKAKLIVSDSISIDEPIPCANALYYIERRPKENGRCVIVKVTNGESTDLLPAPYSARSRVHEYGGGCYCIDDPNCKSPMVYFINDGDQDVYSIINDEITRLTHSPDLRFADLSYDRKFQRLIAVAESHPTSTEENSSAVVNRIVSIDIKIGAIFTIISGDDFYASPKLNSSSTKICWQSWNHPDMPWDDNKLWLANIDVKANIIDAKIIVGSDSTSASKFNSEVESKSISTFQPQWSPDDVLYFISDETDWWHLYRYQNEPAEPEIQQLTYGKKEFGLPQWVFSQSTYAFIDAKTIICSFHINSKTQLAKLSLTKSSSNNTPELSVIESNWIDFNNIRSHASKIVFLAASETCFPQLLSVELNSNNKLTSNAIKTTSHLSVTKNYYSIAQPIEFTNRHNQTVFANYYPPTNPDHEIKKNQPPPLIVICHGGPTGQSSLALDPKKQFWTSRGFALLDVNYSGSTGYGKNYRLRLNKNWGKRDVEDCCDAALYAVAQNLAHKDQLIIRGSSAGGYTVLAALTFENVFSAGASYYGISELTSLASDTHKFESRYLDRLIGPHPESKKIYQERSPINFTEKLNCPVIFFQGIDDRVVPKEQAEMMFSALKERGLPVAAQYFKGEQHGFRKAETIVQSLENELLFYRKVFNLEEDATEFLGNIETSNI